MRFLLDVNVLSELRKAARCDLNVRRWFETQEAEDLAISVITLGEISAGIAQKALRDVVQAGHLQTWLEQLQTLFADRILPITGVIAVRWGSLSPSQPLPAADGLLAATALEHNLVCVTRNTRDFERSGVRFLNPWDAHD
jgi:toxin FitB